MAALKVAYSAETKAGCLASRQAGKLELHSAASMVEKKVDL